MTTVFVTGETVWRGLRLPGAPPLDHMSVWPTGQERTIDISKATGELGHQPVRTREEGMPSCGHSRFTSSRAG